MHKLHQFRLCPFSRAVRIALGEVGAVFEPIEQSPWSLRAEFLALNPAGDLPVLELAGGPVLCGLSSIVEFVAEEPRRPGEMRRAVQLLPGTRDDRAEIRRLVDWFRAKFDREVTRDLLENLIYTPRRRGVPPVLHPEARANLVHNLRYHLGYVGFLAYQRRWLAGDDVSMADFAAGAFLSVVDYFGLVPWEAHPVAKEWYARVKSRPSFRPLLADRVDGLAPAAHYDNLDF